MVSFNRFRTFRALFKLHWASVLFVLLALGLWGWVIWEAAFVRMITWEAGTDYWEHAAALHALTENPWHPLHPHLAIQAGSPRFGPQFLLIALIARAFELDAIQAMTLAAVLNTLLFLCGIRAFFLAYFRSPLAPLYGLLVMFGGWWLGFHYSNVYALPELFSVASYPSTTALGLTLLGFALTVRLLRAEVRRLWLGLVLLGLWAAAVFIIHPLTAMLALSGALLLAVVEPKVSWRRRFEVAGVVVVGCALSHFWPYFSPWVVIRGGHGRDADWAGQSLQQAADLHVKRRLHHFYRPLALLRTVGLGGLTLLTLPYFFLRRARWFVALGTLGMLVPFVANAYVEIPLGHRFVLLAIVYLHIGVVTLLLRLTPGYPGAFRILRFRIFGIPFFGIASGLLVASTLLVFSVHSVQTALSLFDHPRFRVYRQSPVIRDMRAIAAKAGPGAVVLASPNLSWPLASFGPKVLLLLHDDPLVSDAAQRESSVKDFLAGDPSNDERRAILKRYGVTHVLLQRETGPVHFLSKVSTPRALSGGHRLYTLRPKALRAKP